MSNLETAVQEMITQINELRAEGKCTSCAEPVVHEFKDELSRREFEISGMCQSCQDQFFEHCAACGSELDDSDDGLCGSCEAIHVQELDDEPPF